MNRKFFAVAAMMLLMPLMMGAQTLKGSYFLDNSLNRNKLNPAFAPQSGYFQIPVVGNTSVGLMSNLDVETFFYPMGGQLYTFLNKNVTFEQFDAALADAPHFDIASDINLINFGFKGGEKGFWTVDLGMRVNVDTDLPRDLFLFMKKGTGTAGTYNIGAIKANASAAVQAALGYSRDLSDLVPGLRAGAKARVILPVGYAGLNLENVSLDASAEKWTVKTDGTLHTAVKGLQVVDSQGAIAPEMNGSLGLAGFGFSFDLGAEYKLEFDGFINGVSVSAAVTDLGVVSYNAGAVQAYETSGQMDWTGLKISLEEGAMDGAMDELKEGFGDLLSFKKAGESSLSRSTLPSFYLGAEMPFMNNKMSVGALFSSRKSYNYSRNEMTLSYNLNPVNWLSAGLNYSFLNTTKTIGWIVELSPKKGPCFFIGSDHFFLSKAKAPENFPLENIPMSWRFNLHFGLAVALGGK